jgi:hypothetical protein
MRPRRAHGWFSAAAMTVLALAAPASAGADKVDDLSRALTSDPNFKVRLTAALVLGKLRDKRATPALIQALGDKNETVRGMSASSLGSLGDPTAVAALEPLERDQSDYVRARAKEALQILRPAGGGGPPAAAERVGARDKRVALSLGAVDNKTQRGGANITQRVREALVKQISDAPGVALGARPDGFLIDTAINELRHSPTALGVDVVCEVEFIVGKAGTRAIVGMTSGGATVQVPRMSWHPAKEELYFERACENAIRSAHPNLLELFQKVERQEKK